MKVLIVDDDIATVDFIKTNIGWEKLGISSIFTAYNIKQAKEILSGEEVDIVISDIEMPQGTGLDLLKWFRENDMKGEFLFLTCHENFSYASDALKMHAFEYLLKPCNIGAIEASVKSIIKKLEEQNQRDSRYKSDLTKGFFQALIEGVVDGDIQENINKRNLDIDADAEYIAITSNITNTLREQQKMNQNMFIFMIENLHNEAFFSGNAFENIVCCQNNRGFFVETVCCVKDLDVEGGISAAVLRLIESVKNTLSVNITVCIGEPCRLEEIPDTYQRHVDLLKSNFSYTDSFFYEYQIGENKSSSARVLDFKEYKDYFMEQKKLCIMSGIKNILYEKMMDKSLNNLMLFSLRQELNQIVMSCFSDYAVTIEDFMSNPEDIELSIKATESTANMMKWVSYLVDCYIECLEKNLNKDTDIEKINRYIREHFSENIGRNEIATCINLAPEYVSKLYKKKTGVGIKDYLNEYRIEQAKLLLKNNSLRVSDISEMVGFDSFTYFSTIFKKYTDMTPNEYRKSQKLK